MDFLSLASAFSNIIALIGQFRSERAGKDQSTFNSFLEWLITSQHEDLAALVESNIEISKSIQGILQQDRQLILTEIENINKALLSYASAFKAFSDLALALGSPAILSNQALSILRQIEKASASKFLELNYYGGPALTMLDGNSGVIDVDELRFLEDDISSLLDLKLLRLERNKNGERVFIYTRMASELVCSKNLIR